MRLTYVWFQLTALVHGLSSDARAAHRDLKLDNVGLGARCSRAWERPALRSLKAYSSQDSNA